MATPDIIERVELIRNKINELMLRFLEIDFDGELEWHREDASQNNVAIGVDSSYTSRIFKFAYLYLVRGVAIPYSSSTDLRSCLVSDSDGDVHFLAVPGVDAEKGFRSPSPPIRELKKILSHKSKDIEIELGYKAYLCVNDFVDEEDIIILMDGSGRGFLPYRFKKEDESSLQEFYKPLKESWRRRINIIKELSRENNLIFISKTQTRTYYNQKLMPYISHEDKKINILVPDVILIDEYFRRKDVFKEGVREPGFSDPVVYNVREKILEDEDIKHVTIFYAVFRRGGGMYQISLVGDYANKTDLLREIFRKIMFWSPGGYPEPLREAHHMAKISYKDFQKLLYIYGINLETGREVLEL